jgi:hypothetical protein
VTVAEPGFPPGSLVLAGIYSTPTALGSTTADSAGVARLTFTVPAGVPSGAHTLVLSGGGVVRTSQVSVTSTLPKTGAGLGRLVAGALGLLGSGAVLVWSAHNRRRRPGTASP